MKSRILVLLGVSLFFLCQTPTVFAQGVWYMGGGYQGIFMGRTQGQPLRGTTVGIFGNQTLGMPLRGPASGVFGVQTVGQPVVPYPNRFGIGAPLVLNPPEVNPFGYLAALGLIPPNMPQATAPVPLTAPANVAPSRKPLSRRIRRKISPLTSRPTARPAQEGTEGAAQTAQTPAATLNIAPAFGYTTLPRTPTPVAYAARTPSYVRSPQLSQRLTRIAPTSRCSWATASRSLWPTASRCCRASFVPLAIVPCWPTWSVWSPASSRLTTG